jgi:hypothetical protein
MKIRSHVALAAVAVLVAPTVSWAAKLTCLTGTDPSVTNDLAQIAAVRRLIDGACVCASFDGSPSKTHAKYVSCASGVISSQVSAGNLRTQCKATVKKYYSASTCGWAASKGEAPCIKTSATGRVSCSIKAASKCKTTSCPTFTTCIDAADTNGDGIIEMGDSGACASSVPPPGLITYDCTPATGCMQLNVLGDPVDTTTPSGFYGNVDPCLRRDPNGDHALYFLYSFPLVVPRADTPTVEIHLAKSADHGATWNFLTKVWPYAKQADGNYTSHEVSNLAAQNVNGATTWYAISHYYEVPPGGSAANPNSALYVEPVFTQSAYFVLASASDPAQLAAPTDSTILISGGTTSAYASLSSPNLTTISGDPHAVTWREPALLVQGDVLYLAAQAANANGVFSYIGIFAARTTGKMSTWTWKYLGKLFAAQDPVQALPAAKNPIFTEIDLTQRPDDQIVAIMTAMDLANGQKYGSRTADVATLGTYEPVSAAAMVRDGQGRLILTGEFTASDLNVPPNQGPGASTYEAAEPDVGLLIARRGMQPNVHGFTFNTAQHPE